MNGIIILNQIELIGIGLAFIVFLLVFVFAFAVHPRLFRPRLLGPEEPVHRAYKFGWIWRTAAQSFRSNISVYIRFSTRPFTRSGWKIEFPIPLDLRCISTNDQA